MVVEAVAPSVMEVAAPPTSTVVAVALNNCAEAALVDMTPPGFSKVPKIRTVPVLSVFPNLRSVAAPVPMYIAVAVELAMLKDVDVVVMSVPFTAILLENTAADVNVFAPLMLWVVAMVTRLLVRSLIADSFFTVLLLFLKKIASSAVFIASSPADSCPEVGVAVVVLLRFKSKVWAMAHSKIVFRFN